MHTVALNHLLALATSLSLHFKEATAALPEDERKLLEDSIRAAVGGKGRGGPAVAKGQEEAPRIELRMFG